MTKDTTLRCNQLLVTPRIESVQERTDRYNELADYLYGGKEYQETPCENSLPSPPVSTS